MKKNEMLNIAFLSTYLPRECGLATFTKDLMDELERTEEFRTQFNAPSVIAVNDNHDYAYGSHVIAQINQDNRMEYGKIAIELNHSKLDLLVIQHEFGIYGGESGVDILDLVEHLKIPFIVILHTVLTDPTPMQQSIVKRLGDLSYKVVTMAQRSVDDLRRVYNIAPHKIAMIHHGVPFVATPTRDALKASYRFENKEILSTFGFLSPGKGIEYAIESLRGVVGKYPNVLYRILGKTHPVVKREVGEVYRHKLVDLVLEHGLEKNVQFVDKLLTQGEVVQSLVLSDIYITPYLGKDQAVSGTLAYGMGYGRVIISTPYRYANEMLAGGRGLLTDFRDSASLTACILKTLDDPQLKKSMEDRTRAFGRTMMWSEVSKQYAALFRSSIHVSDTYHGRVS